MGVPGLEVRYYFDADPDAPGAALARERGVRCRTDGRFDDLHDDDVDLILETTGAPHVLEALAASKHPDTRLPDPACARILATSLTASQETTAHLEQQLRDGERRLAELGETAERAPMEMARYLRQASHQVKTPLSAIETYVNVILGGYTGEIPDRTREIVEKIKSRCEAALRSLAKRRMLADLRCGGRDALEMTTVHLNELAGQAVDLHAALAGERGVEVRLLAFEGADLVRCDPHKTVVLLAELVENAVVYSRTGGRVEVTVRPAAGGRLKVDVRDHGIGVPARCLPRIFDEDYRADPAVKHHADGAGLGLAIARQVADLHEFRLTVKSEEGRGSVFTLTVPLAAAA
jgi:signal transduction histidine kinase